MDGIKAVVLAAGKGTRLQTEGCDLPKVMRLACLRPLLAYVLDGLSFIPKNDTIIVVGYKKQAVIPSFPGYTFAVQEEQKGTGHAVMCAGGELRGFTGSVLVCCGDMPLLRRETYMDLCMQHEAEHNACTILAGVTESKLPYGRIVRDENGVFLKMVEEKDCSPAELEIKELNAGVYVFTCPALLSALSETSDDNAQGEYYLTDVPGILRARGEKVSVCTRSLGTEIIGVNTLEQLKETERILLSRG